MYTCKHVKENSTIQPSYNRCNDDGNVDVISNHVESVVTFVCHLSHNINPVILELSQLTCQFSGNPIEFHHLHMAIADGGGGAT